MLVLFCLLCVANSATRAPSAPAFAVGRGTPTPSSTTARWSVKHFQTARRNIPKVWEYGENCAIGLAQDEAWRTGRVRGVEGRTMSVSERVHGAVPDRASERMVACGNEQYLETHFYADVVSWWERASWALHCSPV